jgi:HPt (histidine-containing phosphotransfer) domain-containing protein
LPMKGAGHKISCARAQLIDRATEAHRLAMSVHWDNATALHRLEGDASLLQELIVIFFEEYPKLSDRLRQGLAGSDLALVREAAHSLKGSLGYVGFTAAAELALEIENASRKEDALQAASFADALMTEIEAVKKMMASPGERNRAPVIG